MSNVARVLLNDLTSMKGREEWNQKCWFTWESGQALVGTRAEILPMAENTKWTCVGDLSDLVNLKIHSIIV